MRKELKSFQPRPMTVTARAVLFAECVIGAARECFEYRDKLGPLARHARRRLLARRGPTGGWPNPVTERCCVWLATDWDKYRGIMERVVIALLTSGLKLGDPMDSTQNGRLRQMLASYLSVCVAPYVRDSPEATRFVGSISLTEVDWPRIADWFLTHRAYPEDLAQDR